ncbi:type II secretion system F family protein [Leifsonia sp. TF02-11]|uniref:type II secretion system F family protein n=1 Tax=Leifsonia sp. TF02-11 TaxID=2815212 RepID=UPI001AA1D3DA|nr:type II secretion system F family protein [Leifsonia sp. TF02-11]MBO1741043.1 type II secretion system F family protein [Leifsonia sp. TF02-11]
MSDINFLEEAPAAAAELTPAPKAKAKPAKAVALYRSTREEIAETLEDVESLLRAGESEYGTVNTLSRVYAGSTVGEAYGRMAERIAEGVSLTDAFNNEENVFPRVARDLLIAGVNQQILWRNLRRSAELIRNNSNLTAELRVKLGGPISLAILTVIIIVVSVNLAFSNPASLGPSAAVVATMMMNGTKVLGILAGIALVGGVAAMTWYNKTGKKNPRTRLKLDRLILSAPKRKRAKLRQLLSKVTIHDAAAKFCEVLASSLDASMDEPEALRTAARATGNEAIILHVDEHIQRIYDGVEDLAGVAASPYFPKILAHRLTLQPGALERITVLQELSVAYGKKAQNASTELANRLGRKVEDFSLFFGVATVFMLMTPMAISLQDMGSMTGHV